MELAMTIKSFKKKKIQKCIVKKMVLQKNYFFLLFWTTNFLLSLKFPIWYLFSVCCRLERKNIGYTGHVTSRQTIFRNCFRNQNILTLRLEPLTAKNTTSQKTKWMEHLDIHDISFKWPSGNIVLQYPCTAHT